MFIMMMIRACTKSQHIILGAGDCRTKYQMVMIKCPLGFNLHTIMIIIDSNTDPNHHHQGHLCPPLPDDHDDHGHLY